jgi:ABC-type multidrug transport system, ATPase component
MTPRLRIAGVAWEVGGRPVLSGVTFDVRAGEVAVVLGRNGAGKSTLLDIVAGLRQSTAETCSSTIAPSLHGIRGRAPGSWRTCRRSSGPICRSWPVSSF